MKNEMTNMDIERALDVKVTNERHLIREILELICLADERKIYAERGYPSLFDWLVKRFNYSESSANRRISAARLLRDVPSARSKIESGELNLTTMAKAQTIIRAQEKASCAKVSVEQKVEALKTIESKSTPKAEQALYAMFPDAVDLTKAERVVVVSENSSRVTAAMSNEVMERFKKVKARLSNKMPNATFIEVVDHLFQEFLKVEQVRTSAAAKQCVKDENKTLTPRTKKIVIAKADGGCEFRDAVTGNRCGSTHQLQVDHKQMRAHGGNHRGENLRALCATHNRHMSEKILGADRANRWRSD